MRIPLATWFRFRQAAGRTRCSLLVLAQEPLAQSSAAVVLECAPRRELADCETVLSGLTYEVRSGRVAAAALTLSVTGLRKPPVATWQVTTQWQQELRA
jgi:hypothetical protein